MARCGIRRSYPVKLIAVADDGLCAPAGVIGTAESPGQAFTLAERQGFLIREIDDGGHSRFVHDPSDGRSFFLVTVYPD